MLGTPASVQITPAGGKHAVFVDKKNIEKVATANTYALDFDDNSRCVNFDVSSTSSASIKYDGKRGAMNEIDAANRSDEFENINDRCIR